MILEQLFYPFNFDFLYDPTLWIVFLAIYTTVLAFMFIIASTKAGKLERRLILIEDILGIRGLKIDYKNFDSQLEILKEALANPIESEEVTQTFKI